MMFPSCVAAKALMRQAAARTSSRAMSSTAKVWVDKNTRVICQGFTGKQVRIGFFAVDMTMLLLLLLLLECLSTFVCLFVSLLVVSFVALTRLDGSALSSLNLSSPNEY